MKIDTPKLSKADIERAMITPSAVFDTPAEIVEAESLTRPQKMALLQFLWVKFSCRCHKYRVNRMS
jgi:hypothetical protein